MMCGIACPRGHWHAIIQINPYAVRVGNAVDMAAGDDVHGRWLRRFVGH